LLDQSSKCFIIAKASLNHLKLDGLETKSNQWKEVLREPQLKENQLDFLIDEMTALLRENQDKSFGFKDRVLSGKGCFFRPNSFELTGNRFGDLILNEFKVTEMLEKRNAQFKLLDSNILTVDQQVELLKLCKFGFNTKFTLIYRATVDGFGANAFHSKCDDQGKTLTIIAAKGFNETWIFFLN
jgi:hypothetical protein